MLLGSSAVGRDRDQAMHDDRPPQPPSSVRRVGALLWPGATALTVCLFWTFVESKRPGAPTPFEDAAMSFRYAENLARGWGTSWNGGQGPGLTDGAADLGMVLVLAALNLVGLPSSAAAAVVNLAAVFGIGVLLGALNVKLWQWPLWLPIALAALVSAGPVSRYVLSGFSPPVLAWLLLAAFTFAALSRLARSPRGALAVLAVAGTIAGISGWWRPEAFALAPLVVVSGLLVTRRIGVQPVASLAAVCAAVAPFALFVIGWASFRISFFDQLLPTSRVMKFGSLHGANSVFSLQFYGSLLLPLVGMAVVAMLGRGRARNWWMAAALLTAPLLWVNAALPQDFWTKLGLAVVPVVCTVSTVVVFVPAVVALVVAGVRRRDGSWVLPAALIAFSLVWVAVATTPNWWGHMQWPLIPVLAAIATTQTVAAENLAYPAPLGGAARRTPAIVLAVLTCIGLLPFHLPVGGHF